MQPIVENTELRFIVDGRQMTFADLSEANFFFFETIFETILTQIKTLVLCSVLQRHHHKNKHFCLTPFLLKI